MSHCGFLLRVKRENTSNRLQHPLLGFKNIATCLKEIPETGGAALETTVMTSPHLADFISLRGGEGLQKSFNVHACFVVSHLSMTRVYHACQQEQIQTKCS